MMLHTCCSSIEFTSPAQTCASPSSVYNRQTLSSPSPSYRKLFLGFNSCTRAFCWSNFDKSTKIWHSKKRSPDKNGVSVGFKLHRHSELVDFPKKNMNKVKRKKYGDVLTLILRDLESENDMERTLEKYHDKLGPKEQTVILKEQRSWGKTVKLFEWFKSQKDYTPNVIHYNIVLRALGIAQEWDELRLCWIDMAKKGVLPTNNTYGMLVDVYGKAGMVKEALLWIKNMKLRGVFPDEVTMSTVVKVLKDVQEYDMADKFYRDWCVGKIELEDHYLDKLGDQDGISLKQFLSTELFRFRGRAYSLSDPGNAEVYASRPRLTATYNTLIDLYGKAGRMKDAADVFGDMLKAGVALDAFTFNTMIYICGSRGSLSEAEALLREMEDRGISPDTKTYNIFISLYANFGNIDAALKCYRKIREVGLFPDVVTHRTILKILCERNMVPEVEAVLQEMEKGGNRIDENSLPVLAKLYVNAGLPERSTLLIEKSPSYGRFSSRSYAAMIDVYAEKGLWAEAEALFFSRRDGRGQDVLEYNVMIKAYGKAELYDKAISLFRGMRNQGKWPDECTYNSLIQMLAGGDLEDKATGFLAEMRRAGFKPSCSTFSAVIASFAKKKRLSDAIDVFQEMLRADVKPNDVVYGALINAFAEEGNFEEANNYFQALEVSGVAVNQIILTSMVKAYGKIGSVEGAKRMYEKMKLIGGPDIVASNSMLNLYAKLGMVSEAKLMYDYLREKDLADGITFAAMMHTYKNMGMLDEAIEVAGEMKMSGLLSDSVAYNEVMACNATNGLLVECGELLHEMVVKQKISPNAGTFKVLFTVLKKAGFPMKAVKQLVSAFKEGKHFAKQAVVISVFSILGLHSYALESCGISKTDDAGFNAFAYNAAIRAYAAYGKTDEAFNMFMRMQDEGLEPDIVSLINLVNCYGKAGIVEGVKRIHSQLKDGAIAHDPSLYRAIVDAYRSTNRHDLADLVSQN